MAKNFSKYNVEGVGENLSKGKVASKCIKDYIEKNKLSSEQALKEFPGELQNKLTITTLKEAEDVLAKTGYKRFDFDALITTSDKVKMLVSNQWGSDNIGPLFQKLKDIQDIEESKKHLLSLKTISNDPIIDYQLSEIQEDSADKKAS